MLEFFLNLIDAFAILMLEFFLNLLCLRNLDAVAQHLYDLLVRQVHRRRVLLPHPAQEEPRGGWICRLGGRRVAPRGRNRHRCCPNARELANDKVR
jgi:hypothetical protein